MEDILDGKGIIGAIVLGILFILIISVIGGKDSEMNKTLKKTILLENTLARDSIFYTFDYAPAVKYHYAEIDSINSLFSKIEPNKRKEFGAVRIAEFYEKNYKFYYINRKGKSEIYTFFRPLKIDSSTTKILHQFYLNEPTIKTANDFLVK